MPPQKWRSRVSVIWALVSKKMASRRSGTSVSESLIELINFHKEELHQTCGAAIRRQCVSFRLPRSLTILSRKPARA